MVAPSNSKKGSGKVLDSGPDDSVFIYYTDHGGPGVVASNATEDSWAEYCPGYGAPSAFDTCLGDLYSISWLEDCDIKDLRNETLQQQYEAVRARTLKGTKFNGSSHVTQYGDMSLSAGVLSSYMGSSPPSSSHYSTSQGDALSPFVSIPQRDADLLHFQHKVRKSAVGTQEYLEAQEKLRTEIAHRQHVDYSINNVGNLLFGFKNSAKVLTSVRPAGQPLVDDWDCLKTLVRTYEKYCGSLSSYGLKYMRHIANMCNAGITADQLVAASIKTCS
uniref:Legumain prodomain domain-containing protein n=1 Tax=Ficus carica TaxID=3494 RepID=A0AA88E7Z4_FICCA|nr:hypothetical protein TIFTF001_038360 [Ficus carica]GMN69315.1 hypothetical protein TIFTF001_038368 [Ficus carica]